jgi:hypothetical protein
MRNDRTPSLLVQTKHDRVPGAWSVGPPVEQKYRSTIFRTTVLERYVQHLGANRFHDFVVDPRVGCNRKVNCEN